MFPRGLKPSRAALLAACAATCLLFAAPVASAEPAPGLAGPLYDPGKVVVIDLTLPPASETTLIEHPTDEYVEGFLTLRETAGTPGTEVSPPLIDNMKVGIKLKGHVGGSFRPLDTGKAAFKVKCNFVSGQKCFGMKKMTLNNMVDDPSMVHETLAYKVFRAIGVPSSRTGFADVRVNGHEFGVYLDIETLDATGLERWFGKFKEPPQHLYEGEHGADVTPGGAGAFEVDEGETGNRSDLEALIAAVNSAAGPTWSAQVGPVADLTEMTRMWAVEKYVGNWDGYAGMTSTPEAPLPNNYYLYSDPTGVFQMFPWGTDQTWGEHLAFDGEAGLMFGKCLRDSACLALYRQALGELPGILPGLNLDALAAATAQLLKPWQALETAPPREFTPQQIEAGVAAARAFVAARPGELDEWLNPKEKSPGESPNPSPTTTVELHAVYVGRARAVRGLLSTSVRLTKPGLLRQTVKIGTARGQVGVCSTQDRVSSPRRVTLRCRLSATARRRLSKRWLKLQVVTRFAPDGGQAEAITRRVFAPRLPS
jgi:hypothetical protein